MNQNLKEWDKRFIQLNIYVSEKKCILSVGIPTRCIFQSLRWRRNADIIKLSDIF